MSLGNHIISDTMDEGDEMVYGAGIIAASQILEGAHRDLFL